MGGEVTDVPVEAVVFDFHGVISTPPLAGVEGYERDLGLPVGTLTDYMRGHPLVQQLERDEIEPRTFWQRIRAEVRGQHGVDIDLRRLVEEMDGAIGIREGMVALVEELRPRHRTAMLTNVGRRSSRVFHHNDVRKSFDVVVESAEVGLRKPDPAIYQLVVARLGVAPVATVFIDDWAENLPPAAELGIRTIAFEDEAQCRDTLRTLGLDVHPIAAKR